MKILMVIQIVNSMIKLYYSLILKMDFILTYVMVTYKQELATIANRKLTILIERLLVKA